MIGFPGGAVVKKLPANAGDAGDPGSILGSGRSAGVGNNNPIQYSNKRNITLLTKVHIVKAMIFPVCMDMRVDHKED